MQIHVKDDAKGIVKICLTLECFGRIEKYRIKAIFPQEAFKTPKHARIIIHNKNSLSIRQE